MIAATLQPRQPATNIDLITNSAQLQGPPIEDDDVPTPPQRQGSPGAFGDVDSAAPKEEVKKVVYVDAIEPIHFTHNLRSRRQRVVFYNEEDCNNEEDENLVCQNSFDAVRRWTPFRLQM